MSPPACLFRVRLVLAERVRGERIPGSRESPRPRASAQRTVIAHSAAVLELRGIVQLAKQRRVAVDIHNPILTNVAYRQRKKARRADVAGVRNEQDAVAIPDSITA